MMLFFNEKMIEKLILQAIKFLFMYTITKALRTSKEFRDDKMDTPQENDAFVKRYMPRIFIAINKLCEFVNENK